MCDQIAVSTELTVPPTILVALVQNQKTDIYILISYYCCTTVTTVYSCLLHSQTQGSAIRWYSGRMCVACNANMAGLLSPPRASNCGSALLTPRMCCAILRGAPVYSVKQLLHRQRGLGPARKVSTHSHSVPLLVRDLGLWRCKRERGIIIGRVLLLIL